MLTHLTPTLYQQYLLSKESLLIGEIIATLEELMKLISENDLPLFENIMNLPSHQTGLTYAVFQRTQYLKELIQALSWEEGRCKDKHKDIPWELWMSVHDELSRLWGQETSHLNSNESEDDPSPLLQPIEEKLINFIKAHLFHGFREFKIRLEHLRMQMGFDYLNGPQDTAPFSFERPGTQILSFRNTLHPDVLSENHEEETDEDAPEVSEFKRWLREAGAAEATHRPWYAHSEWIKSIFYPNPPKKPLITFSKKTDKTPSGHKRLREWREPNKDAALIEYMLSVCQDLRSFDPGTPVGRAALLMAFQCLGEASSQLSLSLRINLDSAKDFPFKSLVGLRNQIKISLSKSSLSPVFNPDPIYLNFLNELKTVTLQKILPQLEEMRQELQPYMTLTLDKTRQAWSLAHRSALRQLNKEEKQHRKTVLKLLYRFSNKSTESSAFSDMKRLLESILSDDFPWIETQDERAVLAKQCEELFNTRTDSEWQNNPNKIEEIMAIQKKFKGALEYAFVQADRMASKKDIRSPSLKEADQLIGELKTIKASEKDFSRESLITRIQDCLDATQQLLPNTALMNIHQARQTLDGHTALGYATRFYITVVGQIIHNVNKDETFRRQAPIPLIQEFLSLRWLRNNEMHLMNQSLGESLLYWYQPPSEGASSIPTSGLLAYFEPLKQAIKRFQNHLDAPIRDSESPFLIECLRQELREQLEQSSLSYLFNVDRASWLHRDHVALTWQLFLNTQPNLLRLEVDRREQPPIKNALPQTIQLYQEQELPEVVHGDTLTVIFQPRQRPINQWTAVVFHDDTPSYQITLSRQDIEKIIGQKISQSPHMGSLLILSPSQESALTRHILTRNHLFSAQAYLLEHQLPTANRVTPEMLRAEYEDIQKAAEECDLIIHGFDRVVFSKQQHVRWTVAFKDVQSLSFIEHYRRMALFSRSMARLIGRNFSVTEKRSADLISLESFILHFEIIERLNNKNSPVEIGSWIKRHSECLDPLLRIQGKNLFQTLGNACLEDSRYIRILAYFIKRRGLDPNTPFHNGNTLLHEAAIENATDLIKFLIQLNTIDVNQKNDQQLSPLECAEEKNNSEAIALLNNKTKLTHLNRLHLLTMPEPLIIGESTLFKNADSPTTPMRSTHSSNEKKPRAYSDSDFYKPR